MWFLPSRIPRAWVPVPFPTFLLPLKAIFLTSDSQPDSTAASQSLYQSSFITLVLSYLWDSQGHCLYQREKEKDNTSILYPVLNIDWRFVSYMIVYMFQCHSPKSSHPLPLPQSPYDCSIHLCLFCCLACRIIVTIFLNSVYMC